MSSLWAVAEWDYAGSQEDELSMKRGEIIQILDRSHEEWWEGDINGNTGVFPANRCRLLTEEETASVLNHELMNPFRSQNNSPAIPTPSSKAHSSNTTTVLQQLEEAEHMEDEYQQQQQQLQQRSSMAHHQREDSAQQHLTSPTRAESTRDEKFQHMARQSEEIRAPTASRPGSIVPNSIEFVDQPEGILSLPPHWTAVIVEGQGERYYYNVVTNESSWDPPEDTVFVQTDDGEEKKKQELSGQRSYGENTADAIALDTPTLYQETTFIATSSDPLPAGWSSAQDEAGREYFFNEITGETTWDRPPSTKQEDTSVAPWTTSVPLHHHVNEPEDYSNDVFTDERESTASPAHNAPKRQASSDESMLQTQILNLSLSDSELYMLQLDQLPYDQIEHRGPLRVKTQKTSTNATISSWKDYYVVIYLGYVLLYRDDNGSIKHAYAGLSGGSVGGSKGSSTGSGSNDSLAPLQLQQKQVSTGSSTRRSTAGSNSKHAQATRVKPSGCFDADKLVVELSTKDKALTKKKNCFCITPLGSHVRLLLQDTTSPTSHGVESNTRWVHDIQASLAKRKASEAAGLEDSPLTQILRRQTSGVQDASSILKMNKKIEQSDQKMIAEKEKEKEKEKSRTSGIRSMVTQGIQRRRSTQDERLKLPPEDLISQHHSQSPPPQQNHPGSPTSPHHHGQEEESEGIFGRPLLPNRKSSRDRTSQRMSSSGLLSSFKNNAGSNNNGNNNINGAAGPQHGSQEFIPEETGHSRQPSQSQNALQQLDQLQRQKSPGPQRALSPTQTQTNPSSTNSTPSMGSSAAQAAKARLSNMSRNFFSSKDKDKDKDKDKEKDKVKDKHKEQRDKDKEKEKTKTASKDEHPPKKEKKDEKEKDFRQKMKDKVKAKMDKDRKDKVAKKDIKATSPMTSAVGNTSGGSATSDVPAVFGGYLTVEANQTIPKVVELCVTAIEKRGLSTPGIYRVSGHMGSIQNLKRAFNEGLDVEKMVAKEGDINTIAALLKLYFRELKEPLMMFELYPQFIAAADISDYNEKLYFIKELVHSLPEPNFSTLQYLMMHLGRVQDHYLYTKMDSANLAICFAPNLLRQEVDDLTSIINTGKQSSIVDTLIEQREWIFDPYPADDDEEGAAVADEVEGESGVDGDHADVEDEESSHLRQYSQSEVEYEHESEEYYVEDGSVLEEAQKHSPTTATSSMWSQHDLTAASALSPPALPLRRSPSGPFSDSHREEPDDDHSHHHGEQLQHQHQQQQHQQQQLGYALAPKAQYVYDEDEIYVVDKDDDNDDGDDEIDAQDDDEDGRAMLQSTHNHAKAQSKSTMLSITVPPQLPARRDATGA